MTDPLRHDSARVWLYPSAADGAWHAQRKAVNPDHPALAAAAETDAGGGSGGAAPG